MIKKDKTTKEVLEEVIDETANPTIKEGDDNMIQGVNKIAETIEKKEATTSTERIVSKATYDLSSLTPMCGGGSGGREGALSVTNAPTGQRIALSMRVLEYLENPEIVQISSGNGIVVIAPSKDGAKGQYKVKYNKSKGVIYSKSLVANITEYHKLNFEDKTSTTFWDADYTDNEGVPVAVVKIA